MSDRPVIFISYSHKDEPEQPSEGVQWLSFVRTYLQPAVKRGIFDLWVDRGMPGGADWETEIEQHLRVCHVFVLLVSAHSMASDFIIDKEIAIIRERQARGDAVHFYPLVLTPTPQAGLDRVKDKNLRPRGGTPFSAYAPHERAQHMTDAANEIAALIQRMAERRGVAARPTRSRDAPDGVCINGLPETAYERLVGRNMELKRLDDAWADRRINILSLVAEGGAGKSALVNEWLRRIQADSYRGAAAVLGWSFYSQGSKERATSAEPFLDWALDKLGIKIETTSATVKAEAIVEAMGCRRVLLVLDGIEPLQYGLGLRQGELKDAGLRALLRRQASMPPNEGHGLVVLTSRLAVKDVGRWYDGSAPVVDVEQLSEEAGAALLRDNGVWGTGRELQAATGDFGGHPLALGLLASLLRETQLGDVRRRDHIRALIADPDNPGQDHARRVMESYEVEWLVDLPVHRAIMNLVGLFERPASGDCLRALRAQPAIDGLTDALVDLDDGEFRRAVARLRDVRLLAPPEASGSDSLDGSDALDAHPLVREWFGRRLEQTNGPAWRAAHGRLYEHLRDTTKEGKTPTLADLTPLYQAIAHGCRAGRHQEALDEVYAIRICRQLPDGDIEFYARNVLGAHGSNLVAISWFFDKPYDTPVATLTTADRSWVLGEAASNLRQQGRFAEALSAYRKRLQMAEAANDLRNAAIGAANLSEAELLVGGVAAALAAAEHSVALADQSGEEFHMMGNRVRRATALHALGRREEANRVFADAERRQKKRQPKDPLLHGLMGYYYCDLLMEMGDHAAARDRATKSIVIGLRYSRPLDDALDTLTIGRAHLRLALASTGAAGSLGGRRADARTARARIDESVDRLRAYGAVAHTARGLLARAAFRSTVGGWDGAARDLDEVEEIAEAGPMKLHLCDMALERARLALAHAAAIAPLNELLDESPPKPLPPDAIAAARLTEEAWTNLASARALIGECGYHRRDDELAELEAVLTGARLFTDLPPRA